MLGSSSISTVSCDNWKRNTDGTWSKSLVSPSIKDKSNWAYINTDDQQEILDAQENHTFHFHGATKAVDSFPFHGLINSSSESEVSPSPLEVVDPVNKLTERLSLLESQFMKQSKELKRVKSLVSELEFTIDDQFDNIYVLEKQLNRLDQYGRRENIELVGIPNEVTDKELESEVLKILRVIGLSHLQHFNIIACHRIGTKDRYGRRNKIVRFVNRKVENLCPAFKSIFEELSQLKEEGIINKVWSYNGIIDFNKTEDEQEKPMKIFHKYDVENIYTTS